MLYIMSSSINSPPHASYRHQVIAAGPKDMRLFYHSFDAARGRFVVGVASSPDGFKWTKKGIVFDPVAEGATSASHDALGAAALQVVRQQGGKTSGQGY